MTAAITFSRQNNAGWRAHERAHTKLIGKNISYSSSSLLESTIDDKMSWDTSPKSRR